MSDCQVNCGRGRTRRAREAKNDFGRGIENFASNEWEGEDLPKNYRITKKIAIFGKIVTTHRVTNRDLSR